MTLPIYPFQTAAARDGEPAPSCLFSDIPSDDPTSGRAAHGPSMGPGSAALAPGYGPFDYDPRSTHSDSAYCPEPESNEAGPGVGSDVGDGPFDYDPSKDRYIVSKDPDGLLAALQYLGLEVRHNTRAVATEVRPLDGSAGDYARQIVQYWGSTVSIQPNGWILLQEPHCDDLRLRHIAQKCSYRAGNGQIYPLRVGGGGWYECASALSVVRHADPFAEWLETDVAAVSPPGPDIWHRLFTEGYGVSLSTHSRRYLAHAARLLVIPLIGRAYSPGAAAHTITVLTGKQGIGKSLGVKFLFPETWQPYWYSGSACLDDTRQERVENSLGYVLLEFKEMAGTNRAELVRIKAVIDMDTETVRMAYARKAHRFPRRHHYFGTGNPRGTGVIPDDEEHRRWWTVLVPDDSNRHKIMEWMEEHRLELFARGLQEWKELGREAWENPEQLFEEQHQTADSMKRRNAGVDTLADAVENLHESELRKGMGTAGLLSAIGAFGLTGTGEDRRLYNELEVAGKVTRGEQQVANALKQALSERGWREERASKSDRRRVWLPPKAFDSKGKRKPGWAQGPEGPGFSKKQQQCEEDPEGGGHTHPVNSDP